MLYSVALTISIHPESRVAIPFQRSELSDLKVRTHDPEEQIQVEQFTQLQDDQSPQSLQKYPKIKAPGSAIEY